MKEKRINLYLTVFFSSQNEKKTCENVKSI